jgi:TP901 family phage tail tape measure protein
MATSLSALLNIKANVQGEGAVGALGRAVGGLQGHAASASAGMQGLTRAAGAGGLGSAMSALAPLLSGAGLIALGKGAINAADDMNDMAQKTGVSVESLSKFQQAANASGTDIGGVEKALLKMNKGLGQLATEGKGPVADGLKAIGVSAKDARGNMLGADEIMLRVAEKFKTMPDGAAKTSVAMQLFGKAGADMIPMLNGGRESIESLSATMTTKFAQGADAANDKMVELQSKLAAVGSKIGEALLPAFGAITDAVIATVEVFGRLPAPVQQITGVVAVLAIGFAAVAPVISALVPIITGLIGFLAGGAGLAAAFATVGTALGAIVSFITGAATVIAGFITWPVVLVAALVAAGVAIFVFRDQIGDFFKSIGGMIAALIQTVWDMGEPIRAFWVGLWDGIKAVTAPFFSWLGDTARAGFDAIMRFAYEIWVAPFVRIWEAIKEPVTAYFSWLGGIAQAGWGLIVSAFSAVGNAVTNGWNTLRTAASAYFSWLGSIVQAGWGVLSSAFTAVGTAITNGWNAIRGAASAYFSWLGSTAQAGWSVLVSGWSTAVSSIGQLFGALARLFEAYYVRPLVNLATTVWDALRSGWTGLSDWVGGIFTALGRAFSTYVTGPISGAWTRIVDTTKAALRGMLQWAANAMNGVINMINSVLSGVNRVRAALGLSQFAPLGLLQVPAFAQGGFVNGPTLAMVGDNPGGREYVIPEGKAAGFAANYLAGARGAAAIPTSSGRTGGTGGGMAGNVQVNLTTGPVVQQGGERFVTLSDAERIAQQTANQMLAQLRTPGARRALGVR